LTGKQAILGITRALQKCDLTIAVLGRKSLFFLNCSQARETVTGKYRKGGFGFKTSLLNVRNKTDIN